MCFASRKFSKNHAPETTERFQSWVLLPQTSLLLSWWELVALFNWWEDILLKEWWILFFPVCTHPELFLSQGVYFKWYSISHHKHHTARMYVWSPKPQRDFSLGRNCRKNKPALDEPLQERETALEECPTTLQTEKHGKLKSYFTKEVYSQYRHSCLSW